MIFYANQANIAIGHRTLLDVGTILFDRFGNLSDIVSNEYVRRSFLKQFF